MTVSPGIGRVVGGIPAGLEGMEPGPVLAALLSAVDIGGLSGEERVVVMRARQRMISHLQAGLYADMAGIAEAWGDRLDGDAELVADAAAGELRAALRLTRRAADTELEVAMTLAGRVPIVGKALAAGWIDPRRAKLICDATRHLSDDDARAVSERVIGEAGRLSTGQLRAQLARLGMETDPEAAAGRYRSAVEERRVVVEATDTGTGNLFGLDLPAERLAAATRRIWRIARHLHTRHETRTIDQIRADVHLDLLDGTPTDTRPGSGGGMVELTVDLATLAELADTPGELAGYGPVIADIARHIADTQTSTPWRWTVTHPDTGHPVHTGTTRRRPTATQRRHVEARDRTCVFPGCRIPATDCDLDHRIRWTDGGATTTDQLVALCRHDHRIRHDTGWTHQPLPNGDHQWTSPLGTTYTTSGQPP